MHSLNWMGQLLAWIAALTSSRFRYAWRRKGNSHIVRGSKPTVGNGTKYKHPVTAACSRHAATSGSRKKIAPPGGASSETSSCWCVCGAPALRLWPPSSRGASKTPESKHVE